MVSFIASFVLSLFPPDVLDGIWDLIESVSEGFLTYFCITQILIHVVPHFVGRWAVSLLFGNVHYIKYYSVSTHPVIRLQKLL